MRTTRANPYSHAPHAAAGRGIDDVVRDRHGNVMPGMKRTGYPPLVAKVGPGGDVQFPDPSYADDESDGPLRLKAPWKQGTGVPGLRVDPIRLAEARGPARRVRPPHTTPPPWGPWVTAAVEAAHTALTRVEEETLIAAASEATDEQRLIAAEAQRDLAMSNAEAGVGDAAALDTAEAEVAAALESKTIRQDLRRRSALRVAAQTNVFHRVRDAALQAWRVERTRHHARQFLKMAAALKKLGPYAEEFARDADQVRRTGPPMFHSVYSDITRLPRVAQALERLAGKVLGEDL